MPIQYRLNCQCLYAGEQLAILVGDASAALCVRRKTAEALFQRPLWSTTELTAICDGDPGLTVDVLLVNQLLEPFVIQRAASMPTCVVVVTADRPRECLRAIESVISKAHRESSQEQPMTLVVDNSTTAAARYQLATELRDLACRCQTQLLLFTREARERLASAISSANTTAGEAARFALLSTRPGTTDVGAVRNFINLITLGQRVISIDDDIAGPVLRTSCADVTWGSGAQCVPITPLSESNCNHWSRCSLVDAHLELLGQAVGPASSPILLTVSGLRGDCGAENPWRELSGSDVQSPRARLTRQVLRGVAQPMVTPIDGLMTYAWGFVNDGHLPPFMPIGRNQDGAFAAMLRSFRPNALMCHLPVYVTHRPSARRSERRYRDVPAALVRRWRTNDFLASLSHSVPKQRCGRTVNARMSDVLTRVGSEISAGEFATLIEMWIRRQRFHLSAAERWARRSGWRERRRVLRAIERCRTWQFTNEAVIPAEWTHTADLGRYLQNAAKTIARWPELVDVMNHLPRWTRPWADLGESDGVLDLGAA